MDVCGGFEVDVFESLAVTIYTHCRNLTEQSKKKIEDKNNETLKKIVLYYYITKSNHVK